MSSDAPDAGLGRLTFLTLPVRDLDAACAFYVALFGWPPPRRAGAAALFHLQNLSVAFMERMAFTDFINGDSTSAPSALASWNVASRAAVDDLLDRAKAAGARIRRPAGELSWGGWAGLIETPDGHLWEIVWNPRLPAG